MARIEETAKGQKPFTIVVTCSDSRVPPEVLFDQGLGDLFVVRTAGEVVTEVELGSIEYALEHLKATYLVVLGHERCGAVEATLKGGDLPPNIEAIAAQIRPAIEASRFFKGDPLDNAVRENAKMVLAKIKGDAIVSQAIKEGRFNLKAAYYDLDTGKVAALP
jgi:carbonic anhydrase